MEKTKDQVAKWFSGAEPGARLTYKIGKTLPEKANDWLISTGALEVRKLYDAGLVELMQRAIGKPIITKKGNPSPVDRDFEYIVEKRRHPKKIENNRTFRSFGMTGDALAA